MDNWNFMYMNWRGDNIKANIKIFCALMFKVLAYEQI